MIDTLTGNKIVFPVYFTFEDDDLLSWYNYLLKNDARVKDIVVQVKNSGARPYLTEQMHLDVFYGVEQTSSTDGKPIIAISAAYDGFGAAPSLPSGIEASVSPVLAVMYMSRVFGRQFSQVKQRFDLMFILTPGASFGYEPSARFIDYVQGAIKAKIQLVVCLDQLIDSSILQADEAAQTLYIYDSKRSLQSSIRDAFVYNLKQESGRNPDIVASVIEAGLFEVTDDSSKKEYVPFEHVAYASRGLAAITLTVRSPDRIPKTRFEKFSILDTEMCLCKLSKLLFILNEAVAQTIVSPDLQIEG